MSSRCTGHCCKGFVMNNTRKQLKERARAGDTEAAFIDDMLINTGTRHGNQVEWACRHLGKNGDCTVYAQRPQMCKDFPYRSDPCQIEGCTLVP